MVLDNTTSWLMVFLTFVILMTTIFIGINTLALQKYAEVYAYHAGGNILALENTGTKSLYIQKYFVNGIEGPEQYKSLIPPPFPGRFYKLPLDSVVLIDSIMNVNVDIFYQDSEGKEYVTRVIVHKNGTSWKVYTQQQKEVY